MRREERFLTHASDNRPSVARRKMAVEIPRRKKPLGVRYRIYRCFEQPDTHHKPIGISRGVDLDALTGRQRD